MNKLFDIGTRRNKKEKEQKVAKTHVLPNITGTSIEKVVYVSPIPLLQECVFVTMQKR